MFPNHWHVLSFDERDHIIRRMMWRTWPIRLLSIMIVSVSLLLLSSSVIHVPHTMRLWNSQIPEEHFVCYQTSQCKWVIIKVLFRCLWRCLLGWYRSRLGFVTISLASNVTNELVAVWSITKRVKRLAGNEIELGMMIPMIESQASNIPMTKGITYVVMQFDR